MSSKSKTPKSLSEGLVRGRDTGPELIVRRLLHRHGYRYRLHVAQLPGRPDILFPKFRAAIFIHGCFWHQHDGCRKATIPATRTKFWRAKLNRNVARDAENEAALRALGWRVMIVWECELKDQVSLLASIAEFLKRGYAG